MQFIRRHTVFLIVLFFLRRVKADLRKCADLEPEISVDPNQNEIAELFKSFNETNFDLTESTIQLLNRIEMDEINRVNFMSSSRKIKNVVGLDVLNIKMKTHFVY